MSEIIPYLLAIIFMLVLLFDFKKRAQKNPDTKPLGISNKSIYKIATIVIVICIILILVILFKTQKLGS